MIKHIFCDLDGTLYNKGISKEDIKAIEEIEKEGVIFHIATGRVFKQAYKMVNENFKLLSNFFIIKKIKSFFNLMFNLPFYFFDIKYI